jgi:PEP-CTERM motif
MLKQATALAGAIMAITGFPVNAQLISVPTTAASFPADVMPVTAGTIDFWAKLSGFSGNIPVGGVDGPYLFMINNNLTNYTVGFNANDGSGNSGLVGIAGSAFQTGSGGSTYENVLGTGAVDTWHHYTLKWDQSGLAGLPSYLDPGSQKVAVYVDNILRSVSWHIADGTQGTFPALPGVATLNLITNAQDFSSFPPGVRIAIDEFKVFDGNNNLVLYNTLDSVHDVTHSAVGLNGSFNGYGDPTFVPGIVGNALEATPLPGLAPIPPIPEPETYAMLLAGLGLLGFMLRRRKTA